MQPPSTDKPDIITPLKMSGQAKSAAGTAGRHANRSRALGLCVAFLLMVAGGSWLLYWLARKPLTSAPAPAANDSAPEVKPASAGRPPAPAPDARAVQGVDPEQLAAEKKDAEHKLADFLQLQNDLASQGVSDWGGPTYAAMNALARDADRLLMAQDYLAAAQKYTAAVAAARALAGRSAAAFNRMLDEGQKALALGDGEQAQRKFKVALMLDPASKMARHGLKRAQNIEAVMALIKSGRRHEKNDHLAFALADYRQALALDPEAAEARTGLARVKSRISDEQFQQLMSAGLTALANNDYPLARAKLLKAKAFRPDSRQLRDALAQVEAALRLSRIEALQKSARAAEKDEDWPKALQAYRAVIRIDPDIGFALAGQQRAVEQIYIRKRVHFYLAHPAVLESDRRLNNAILLLQQARKLQPGGGRLAEQLKKLQALVTAAQTPVPVTLVSDELTEVAVYRVGKLGRFAVRQLQLRPGTYTVVGARDGYQDVRRQIVVKPGQKPLRITVKCRVKI